MHAYVCYHPYYLFSSSSLVGQRWPKKCPKVSLVHQVGARSTCRPCFFQGREEVSRVLRTGVQLVVNFFHRIVYLQLKYSRQVQPSMAAQQYKWGAIHRIIGRAGGVAGTLMLHYAVALLCTSITRKIHP